MQGILLHLEMAIARTYFMQRRVGRAVRQAEQWARGVILAGITLNMKKSGMESSVIPDGEQMV
jgi:hypothetical protein